VQVGVAIPNKVKNKYGKRCPFGMLIEERSYTATAKGYRFGFNGYENEPDVAGEGAVIDFGARIFDARLGRFFSTDPIVYPYWSPYQYDGNSPIVQKDVKGMGKGDDVKGDKVKSGEGPLAYGRRNGMTGSSLSLLDNLAQNNPDNFKNYKGQWSDDQKTSYFSDGSGQNWNIDPGQELVIGKEHGPDNIPVDNLAGKKIVPIDMFVHTESRILYLPPSANGSSPRSSTTRNVYEVWTKTKAVNEDEMLDFKKGTSINYSFETKRLSLTTYREVTKSSMAYTDLQYSSLSWYEKVFNGAEKVSGWRYGDPSTTSVSIYKSWDAYIEAFGSDIFKFKEKPKNKQP
jgi:RHS repeat-associated protein